MTSCCVVSSISATRSGVGGGGAAAPARRRRPAPARPPRGPPAPGSRPGTTARTCAGRSRRGPSRATCTCRSFGCRSSVRHGCILPQRYGDHRRPLRPGGGAECCDGPTTSWNGRASASGWPRSATRTPGRCGTTTGRSSSTTRTPTTTGTTTARTSRHGRHRARPPRRPRRRRERPPPLGSPAAGAVDVDTANGGVSGPPAAVRTPRGARARRPGDRGQPRRRLRPRRPADRGSVVVAGDPRRRPALPAAAAVRPAAGGLRPGARRGAAGRTAAAGGRRARAPAACRARSPR